MIAIIDGCGANITSVQFALERVGKKAILTTDAETIQAATHVILPGVGTAKQAMQQLTKLNLVDVIRNLTQPVLGICLGMQLLFEYSDEGDVACLGILPGVVSSMKTNSDLIIPHMGWNQLKPCNSETSLLKGIDNLSYVYFVHSYSASVTNYTLATTHYGNDFSAIVQRNNFYGTQFHPEKSADIGELILRNFVNL